ncbi:MAG: hypothetical protein SGILL_004572 [Bacillariaceae sp.]
MDVTGSINSESSEAQDQAQPMTAMNINDNSSPKGRKGGVQFRSRASIEEVRRISRISNYNLEEVISYWGDSDDHVLRKKELKRAAQEFQFQRRMSDNQSFTTLGIADKVGEGRQMKKKNRNISRNAVLDEQDLQDHEGVYDDELISDVYTITTFGAKKSAREQAEALHNQVEEFEQS